MNLLDSLVQFSYSFLHQMLMLAFNKSLTFLLVCFISTDILILLTTILTTEIVYDIMWTSLIKWWMKTQARKREDPQDKACVYYLIWSHTSSLGSS